jgi:hypothetical protein
MTEAEWLACTQPKPMPEFLCGGAFDSHRLVILLAHREVTTMGNDLNRLTAYLNELGLQEVAHYPKGGHSLLEHSLGLYHLMESRGCTEELCRAGLFHQIYGVQVRTVVFALPLDRRGEVRDLLGERAERLVYLNCAMDRSSFDRALAQPTAPYEFTDNFRHAQVRVCQEDFDDLCRLSLYDWLEQVARTRVLDSRRPAYQSMAARLGGTAQEAFDSAVAEKFT